MTLPKSRTTRILVAVIAVLGFALLATSVALVKAHQEPEARSSDTATRALGWPTLPGAAATPTPTQTVPTDKTLPLAWAAPVPPSSRQAGTPGFQVIEPADPFQMMRQMQAQMDQMLQVMGPQGGGMGMTGGWPSVQPQWGAAPSMDLAVEMEEQPSQYVIHVSGSDIANDDVHVDLHGQLLTISGTRHSENQSNSPQGQAVQRSSSIESFQRSMALPGPVQADQMTTQMQNGAMVIAIPKAASGDLT